MGSTALFFRVARQLTRNSRFRNVGLGAFSRAFALGSQFAVLILLGKLLPKSDFGDFMIMFALSRVLSLGMGTGLATLLVYHISRDASLEREHALHRSVVAAALVMTGITAALMLLFAPDIAAWFSKPSLAYWISGLAPFTLFATLLTVSAGAREGRGLITHSILMVEFFPNLIRLLALPTLLLLNFGNDAIVLVMTASVAMPWLFGAVTLIRHLESGFAKLTRWDLQYSWKLTLHSFASMQVQGIDMLIVGWLFTSATAADYAIASRIAALIPFFQQIIVKTFVARSGSAIHRHDQEALQAEIDRSRTASTVLVTLTAVAALLAYPLLASWLDGFERSVSLLAALSLAPVVRSYFPGADALLRIAGLANASLLIMLLSLACVLIFPLGLHDLIGIYSLPLGMLASAIALNPVSAHHIRRRLGVRLAATSIGLPLGTAILGCTICVFSTGSVMLWLLGSGLLLLSLIPAIPPQLLRKGFVRA